MYSWCSKKMGSVVSEEESFFCFSSFSRFPDHSKIQHCTLLHDGISNLFSTFNMIFFWELSNYNGFSI